MNDKWRHFIKRRKVALIGSVDEQGMPEIKAMLAPRKIKDGVFYFSTNTSTKRVLQFRTHPQACLYFFKKRWLTCQGILLKGTMEVLEEEDIKQELWRSYDRMYYPKGVVDPDYCVLRFTATQGRTYHNLKKSEFTLPLAE